LSYRIRTRPATRLFRRIPRKLRVLVGLLLGFWILWVFASEALLAQRLHLQAVTLRLENLRSAEQNADLRRAIAGSEAAAGREEEARRRGFSRPDETVYSVTPPSPAPAVEPKAAATAAPALGWWERLRRWWATRRKE